MTRAERDALPFKLRPSKADDQFVIIEGPNFPLALDGGPNKRKIMKHARKIVEALNFGWRP